MFNKVMTGGACQADATQSGINQNAFTNMMDNMTQGDAMAQQRAEGQISSAGPSQQNMMAMQHQFESMMNQDMMAKQYEQQQRAQMQQPLFAQGPQQVNLNDLWDAGVVKQDGQIDSTVRQQQPMMGGPQQFQQPWLNPGMMMGNRPIYQPPVQKVQDPTVQQKGEEVKKEEPSPIMDASSNMVEVLQNSANPKHRNSEFLKFLKQLNDGALTIDEQANKVVENAEKMKEFEAKEVSRLEQEKVRQEEEAKFKQQHAEYLAQLQEDDDVDEIKDLDQEELTEETFDKMMAQWKEEGMQNGMGDMMQEWNKVWEEEAALQASMFNEQGVKTIKFQENNQFMAKEGEQQQTGLLEKAKQLVNQSKIQEAILCLEAEVQLNKENGEAWRILGQLFQENDQDDFAIIALKNAHEADPYDLESLLFLGISSTNELEQADALKHLTNWLRYHPDFCSLPILAKEGDLDLDEVENAFNEATALKPSDTQVLTSLGVLQFIRRDFNKATVYFEKAIKENPIDHSVWNKYGAALANSMRTEEAKGAYQQALELRPNYVRTLVNIGLAHNNQGEYLKASELFLNALVLNPKAEHIWSYLRQSILQADRFDLLEKVDAKNTTLFAGPEFKLIDPKNLPEPTMDNLYNNKIFME